ncbi:MAG: hypothetical protein M1830_002981 [Pleopsidium flavum]|nr:MAG: hypothetical protein M1830_002981 [Pleopsidium flavum]
MWTNEPVDASTQKSSVYPAPSWSWAAYDGLIAFDPSFWMGPRILNKHDVKGHRNQDNLSRPRSAGTVDQSYPYLAWTSTAVEVDDISFGVGFKESGPADYVMIQIARWADVDVYDGEPSGPSVGVLLLELTGRAEDDYERVGIAWYDHLADDAFACNQKTLTVV